VSSADTRVRECWAAGGDAAPISFYCRRLEPILPAAATARESGGDIKFVGMTGKAATVFEIIGLGRFFQMFQREPDAVDAFARALPRELLARIEEEFVASNKARRYHRLDCKAAARISVVNLLHFYSGEEAAASGRQPCTKCCSKHTQ
jgi:hypothetical protein